MSGLVTVLGVALLHGFGAALLAGASPTPGAALRAALRSPSSAWAGLAVLHALSLGLAGLPLLGVVAAAVVLLRQPAAAPVAYPWRLSAVVAALVLLRPWVPTHWDEYVWLGKARLESLGFGGGVRAALDPALHLLPAGYPPLWPSAVGWLSLGVDSLEAHVTAGSVLVLLSAAAAVEAWAPFVEARGGASRLALGAVLATPLVWVHLRATYVDLPVGLLGLALLGQLLRSPGGRPPVASLALAVALVGFKDEGLAHLFAAAAAAFAAAGVVRARWRLALPAAVGLVAAASWRALTWQHGVTNVDHALGAPQWGWAPELAELLWLHATDLFSWGIFWAVAVAVLVRATGGGELRALRVLVVANLAFVALGLLCGPERVRAFAENGSLVNRLLLQLWPGAALAVLLGTTRPLVPVPPQPAAA